MLEVMGPLSWILVGLLAGVLARFLMPGKDRLGCLMTMLLGVAGAFIGGLLASYLGFGGITGPNVPTLLTATAGAVVLLFVRRLWQGKK